MVLLEVEWHGGVGDIGDDTGSAGNDVEITKAPIFKVEKLEANSIGIDATITIEDEDNTLIGDTNISILKNNTGKTVYQHTETLGVYNIDLSISTLEPDQEYTLVAESTYKVDDMVYTKNFIYKIFRTAPIGISIEKDVFTSTSLGLAININKDTKVKSAEIVLLDKDGNKLQSQTVINENGNVGADKKELIEFKNLTPNTEYTVSITNVLYDGQIITNGFEATTTFTTLKQTPKIQGTEVEINKRDGKFILRIKNVEDPNNGIESYKFEIYDTRLSEDAEPIKVMDTKDKEIALTVDEETIFRNVGYTFKVIASFNDNEKIFEYESEYSEVFKMDGVEFPTIRFEEKEITYEKIEGNIIVEDEGKTIDLENGNFFEITYTDSVGVTKSFTSQGSYTIPVSVNNLRANETYKFAVYTKVDLKDGNDPIDKCYIGGAIVQTGLPKNMVAKFLKDEGDVKNAFNVNFQLNKEDENQGTLEPETLTGMTVSIYAGQTVEGEYPTGSPLRTVKLVDTNLDPYTSILKEQYFDNSVQITPTFFNAQNSDFRDQYYTIVVSSAYDYTDYQNALPILNNVYTVKTNGYMPDLPPDTEKAVTVTPIRNYTSENRRPELDDSTIVGYDVKAVYDNSSLYAKKVIYKAYDATTDQLIETKEIEIGEDGVIPTARFDVLDGTPMEIKDTDALRRGNSYYFVYEMMLDLNGDGNPETKYPYENDVILKSPTQTSEKQVASLYTYPSISAQNTIKFKYQYQDVDHTIENDRNVVAKIEKGTIDQDQLIETSGQETYNEMVFENLTKGELTLTISECLVKPQGTHDKIIVDQYFEGLNLIKDVNYRISVDTNKVSIEFVDPSAQLKYIAGVRVEFTEKNGDKKVVKDFQSIPDNRILAIDYRELGELLKTTTVVNVYAYYDSGIVGYDTDTSKYVTYQKAYKKVTDAISYYSINEDSKLVENPSINGNMYASQRTDNKLALENKVNHRTTNATFTHGLEGFKYQGDVILQKQLNEEPLLSQESNEIYFDLIIPGISLKDDNNNWTINSELDNVKFKADLLVYQETQLVDNTIYVDLYETDSEYKTETFLKTIELKVDDFDDIITITDLKPKNYYFMKFRSKVDKGNGQILEVDLYDMDYQVSGRQYYFSTLADVNVDNIEVTYHPIKYEEKYININYTVERTTGYARIEYHLYHYNKETQTYDKVMDIEPDVIFNKDMHKQIAINPGSGFIFGDKYKIEIIPIAEYVGVDGKTNTLELGKKEEEFTFSKLQNPTIAVKGTREENDTITFKITVYDDDRVIEGNKYRIKILNSLLEDITPEEYKIDYDVDKINNTLTIDNVKNEESYTILVTTKTDLDNDTKDLTDFTKQFTVPSVNKYGISLGDVTVNKNATQGNKMDLFFNNSYKLTEIDQIKYSIYNTNGYAQNGTAKFVPTQIQSGDETYYSYTIDENLTTYEKYYIELQFLKESEVVETLTLEYVYLEN